MSKLTPIEKVSPGQILRQDVFDIKRENVIYKTGSRLNASMINNILLLDYMDLEVDDADAQSTQSTGSSLPCTNYKAGEFVFFQGEPARQIFILKKGIVQVFVTPDTPNIEDPELARRYVNEKGKLISNISGRGAKFGEMAAIYSGIRNASIKCLGEVEVSTISTNPKAFSHTIIASPKLGLSIAITLANRLNEIRKSISDVQKLHSALAAKINSYQMIFNKLRMSLTTKAQAKNLDWLNKIVTELGNVPPLSSDIKFKVPDLEKSQDEFVFKEEILPPEYEETVNINSYVAVQGEPQKNFLILKKGKLETEINGKRTVVHSKPNELVNFLNPLCSPKTYNGTYTIDLRALSPVRVFKIPIATIDDFGAKNPRLNLFLCKAITHLIKVEDEYMVHLLENFQRDLAILSTGDNNYRRAFKKLNRILDKFSKDAQITQVELTLAKSLKESVEVDATTLKDHLNKLYMKKS
ncbi:MAG: cyclic nucleotide-binding domain-containing protein [Candidatus Cloacimonetes bacterium]|nr:cyclic nucleotide-binding domain-containing protein [Candidatus Cloacimonadota bacterium]